MPEWEQRHRLARALEFADLKPVEMARHLDLSENTIRNYLSGRTSPNGGVLRSWALRCGVPVGWLRYGDDYDTPSPDGGGVQDLPLSRWNPEEPSVPVLVDVAA